MTNEVPKLEILIGLPGSGKSTYCKEKRESNSNSVYLSSDKIREELYGNESIQGNPAEVFALMQSRTIEALKSGTDVFYDATNLTRKDRSGILVATPKYVYKQATVVFAPYEMCVERDAARERSVGKEVIDRMIRRFQPPFYDEGFDLIDVYKNYSDEEYEQFLQKYRDLFDRMMILHDNPHHSLPVWEHCQEAEKYVKNHFFFLEDRLKHELASAARLHDCGKYIVKDFHDSKGNPSEHAHYYQHQCASAWQCMEETFNEFVIWLVGTHMDPFLDTKYYRNLDPWMKEVIDILHEADLAAH